MKRTYTPEDLVQLFKLKHISWVYKRTGPKATAEPRLPRVPFIKHVLFDADEIDRLFFSPTTYSSLKSKKIEKPEFQSAVERRKEKLW